MATNDLDFFYQATLQICSSLDIDKVVNDLYVYLKKFIPLDCALLNTFDSDTRTIRILSMCPDFSHNRAISPVKVPPEAQEFIKTSAEQFILVGEAEDHFIGRYIKPYLKFNRYCSLVLPLRVEGETLGVLGMVAKGHHRFNREHARLISLLKDPFTLAMANTLKHREILKLKEILTDDYRYLYREISQMRGNEIIGADLGLKNVMEMVRQVAPLSSQVLILGETGVGKEIIANAIHYSSPRKNEPFIKVNCGAIPENLIDSELFGHEKGAFTGAISRKRGRFERANNGTIFLDEIGELPLQAQIRLLRVIQNREIERVGGEKPIPVDIRIITATHRNLEEMVKKGMFREDLFYRLNVFPIIIPPLRMRKADIPALVNYFIERKSMELNLVRRPIKNSNSIDHLQSYHWPGNVRELENMVERVLIKSISSPPETPLSFENLLPKNELKEKNTGGKLADQKQIKTLPLNLEEANCQLIQRALEIANGRVEGEKGAASLLGINPNTLRGRMKKMGIPYGRKQVI